jgi:hypothetical protein
MYNDANLFREIFTIYIRKSHKKCNISSIRSYSDIVAQRKYRHRL